MVNTQNVAGHRERYRRLKQTVPAEELGAKYVGGLQSTLADIHSVGFLEREILARYVRLDGAHVIDVGCGIGRLTRYLVPTPIARYLGTDVVPEILDEAKAIAQGDNRFEFTLVNGPEIPPLPWKADLERRTFK